MKNKYLRKGSQCLNCEKELPNEENYCPDCGQKNSQLISFKALIAEFFDNLFSYDSKLYRSLAPFLFKPGFLTNEFMRGKRVKYIRPLRLYLIISIIYFFVLSWQIGDKPLIKFNQGKKEKKLVQQLDSLKATLHHVEIEDSLVKQKMEETLDSTQKILKVMRENNPIKQYIVYARMGQLSPDGLLDSLEITRKHRTSFHRIASEKAIRVLSADNKDTTRYLIGNLSVMMFFFIPIVALLMKLLYKRQKRRYTEHVIFTLHMHSFFFFLCTMALIAFTFLNEDQKVNVVLSLGALFGIYMYAGFKKVYEQSWIKTFFKMLLISGMYAIFFVLVLLVFIGVSLLLF